MCHPYPKAKKHERPLGSSPGDHHCPPAEEVREQHEENSHEAIWVTSAKPQVLRLCQDTAVSTTPGLSPRAQVLEAPQAQEGDPLPPRARASLRQGRVRHFSGEKAISCGLLKLQRQSTCPAFCTPSHVAQRLANPALSQCWAAWGFWGGDPCSQSFFLSTSPPGFSRSPGILHSVALHWQLLGVFCLIKEVSGSLITFVLSALWVPCGGGFS